MEILNNEICFDRIQNENEFDNYIKNNYQNLLSNGYDKIIDVIDSKLRTDLKKIDEYVFHLEALDPKEEYKPLQYYIESNIYSKIEEHFKRVISGEFNAVFFSGPKSIGKTLSQNVYLKNNDKYLEENKVFWIRCDCSKLINILPSHDMSYLNTIDYDIIDSYFDIQFLYILAKRVCSGYEFFDNIENLLLGQLYPERISKDPIEITPKNSNIIDELYSLKNQISHHKKINGERYHYGREKILKSRLNSQNKTYRSFDKFISLSKVIQEILNINGYTLIKIIDSVENYKRYNYQGNLSNVYQFILKKILVFHIETKKRIRTGMRVSTFIFMRQNTYWEYLIEYRKSKHEAIYENNPTNICVDLDIQSRGKIQNQIFEKRFDFALKFDDIRNIKSIESIKELVNVFNFDTEDRFFIEFIKHDKHLGYLLRNKVNLFISAFFYKEKYNKDLQNIKRFISENQAVNLMLNGKFNLQSFSYKDDFPNENGKMLFNIFYYDHINYNTNSNWQGLCTTRILQYCIQYASKKREYIINNINILFNYDQSLINVKISKLLFYSLLKYDDGYNIVITDKGKAGLDLIYSNLDILYQCALDSPLPKKIIDLDFITAHDNNLSVKNYSISCLKTVSTFISYLRYIDKNERSKIKNELNIIYSLPLYKEKILINLNKRYTLLLSKLKGNKSDLFNIYLENIDKLNSFPQIINKDNDNQLLKNKKEIFVAFSSSDKIYLNDFKEFAKILDKQNIINYCSEDNFTGDKWESKIENKIRQCDMFICLVTNNLINTEYVFEKEIPLAVSLNKKIVPIILSHCEWQFTDLGQFEAPIKGKVPSKYKSTKAEYWIKVLAEIRKSLK
jgi:hypothetical protein